VRGNLARGTLRFTTQLEDAVPTSDVVFVAVGTPAAAEGFADMSAFWALAERLVDTLPDQALVAIKSTVPVGTNAALRQYFYARGRKTLRVASNPEFMRQGSAVRDFQQPPRVVFGVREQESAKILRQVYQRVLENRCTCFEMSPESAELAKYVCNAFLAMKISFINEMANLCDRLNANIDHIRKVMCGDPRIGAEFLAPGCGYGGSCFPKDVRALHHIAKAAGVEDQLLRAVDEFNEMQKHALAEKIIAHFGGELQGKTIALWGVSFKPDTDDIREAPALRLMEKLLEQGAKLRVHDPAAMQKVRALFGDKVAAASSALQAVRGAEALAISTEWREYKEVDFGDVQREMYAPVVFDGRNILSPEILRNLGFVYYSVGRPR
jgi:UDPglucose 6-dehydrogenase